MRMSMYREDILILFYLDIYLHIPPYPPSEPA